MAGSHWQQFKSFKSKTPFWQARSFQSEIMQNHSTILNDKKNLLIQANQSCLHFVTVTSWSHRNCRSFQALPVADLGRLKTVEGAKFTSLSLSLKALNGSNAISPNAINSHRSY